MKVKYVDSCECCKLWFQLHIRRIVIPRKLLPGALFEIAFAIHHHSLGCMHSKVQSYSIYNELRIKYFKLDYYL